MGFTLAHPALILPIKRLTRYRLSTTGLVIGSIIPDFEYFLRLNNTSTISHTLLGIVCFNLPLALILSFVFHLVVKEPLVNSFPPLIKARFIAVLHFNFPSWFKRHYISVVLSIILGIGTHFLWDAFTSIDGYFVKKIPLLMQSISINQQVILSYKILKHSSSIAGLLLLLYVIYKRPQTPIENQPWAYQFALIVGAIAIAFFLFFWFGFNPSHNAPRHYAIVAKISISSVVASLIVTAGIYKIFRLK